MYVFYRSRRGRRAVVHERVGPLQFCCKEMWDEWDILVGFGVKGHARTTSRAVNIFSYYPQHTVPGVTEIRYCPWCGSKIEVVGVE